MIIFTNKTNRKIPAMANLKKTVKSLTKFAGWLFLLIKLIKAFSDILEGESPDKSN